MVLQKDSRPKKQSVLQIELPLWLEHCLLIVSIIADIHILARQRRSKQCCVLHCMLSDYDLQQGFGSLGHCSIHFPNRQVLEVAG